MRLALKQLLGKVLNLLGAPGFIRAHTCHDRLGVPIEIRFDDLFMTILIEDKRLLFHRLSGQFDGIVLETSDCHDQAPAG